MTTLSCGNNLLLQVLHGHGLLQNRCESLTITGSIGVVTGKFNLEKVYDRIDTTKPSFPRAGEGTRASAYCRNTVGSASNTEVPWQLSITAAYCKPAGAATCNIAWASFHPSTVCNQNSCMLGQMLHTVPDTPHLDSCRRAMNAADIDV